MILLTTSLAKAQHCASTLQAAVSEEVRTASTLCEAVAQLQTQEFSAIIIDQLLIDLQPDEWDTLLKHLGSAVPIYLNFAVSSCDRMLREVRSALYRHKREEALARQNAERILRSELKDTVTALLLSCEMALSVQELPSEAANKMSTVCALVREVNIKLGVECAGS